MQATRTSADSEFSSQRPSSAVPLDALAARLEAPAYALLRSLAGGMFFCHGLQKVFGWLGADAQAVGSQLWIGGVIEVGAGLLVALGLFARPAAFLASGTMAVAYAQFHWQLAFDSRFLPIVNQGELALLYSVVFAFIAAHGGGQYSIDARRSQSSDVAG